MGYPGNYGMIPQTLLPKELGGDGDPLDVLVLGTPLARGSVVRVKLLGVLKLLDGGEQDDKLIALPIETHFSDVTTLDKLSTQYSGILEIIELWFTNYKGANKISAHGYRGEREARKVLEQSVKSYKKAQL